MCNSLMVLSLASACHHVREAYLKYKRNHYVPEFYLNNFSVVHSGDRKAQLWVYDKEKNTPRRQSPKDTAVINDLYTVLMPDLPPNALEVAFGKQESNVSPILAKWAQDGALPTIDAILEVAYFLALLHLRNPKTARWFEAIAELVAVEKAKALAQDPVQFDKFWEKLMKEESIPPELTKEKISEMAKNLDEHFVVKFDPQYTTFSPLMHAEAIFNELKSMYWCLCSAPKGWDFITSDSPVVVRFRKERGVAFGGGFGHPTAKVIFPISPQVCLYLSRNFPYKAKKVNSSFVKNANRDTAINAERFVFASLHSDGIENLVKKYAFTRHQSRLDKNEMIENMRNRAKHRKTV